MQVFKLKYEVTYMEYMYLLLTVVNCGTLSNPANGQVNHTAGTTLGQTATYNCNTGYNLVGASNRTCQATGGWSRSVPACQSTYVAMHVCAQQIQVFNVHSFVRNSTLCMTQDASLHYRLYTDR